MEVFSYLFTLSPKILYFRFKIIYFSKFSENSFLKKIPHRLNHILYNFRVCYIFIPGFHRIFYVLKTILNFNILPKSEFKFKKII